MNINACLVQMLNGTGKGNTCNEKTVQSDGNISFRNIFAEKLNEKGSMSLKEEFSANTLTDDEKNMKDLLSDPFFYFAAQLGFLDNLKNYIKNDCNTGEATSGEMAVDEISGTSISFNKELTDILAELSTNSYTNKDGQDIMTELQTNSSMNKELTYMLSQLQSSTDKELTGIVTEFQNNGSENKALAHILSEFQNNGSENKALAHMLTGLQPKSSIGKELAGIISKFSKDDSISSFEGEMPVAAIQESSDETHIISETVLKDNIITDRGLKELLEKISQSLKDLINSAGTSEELPDTVSSIKELLSQLLEAGDTLKDIIKKSDYKDLQGIIEKSPFLAKVQDLLNLFDRKTDSSSDKKKNVSDIISEANSVVSSLEQAVKVHKNSGKETEYTHTDTSGKEEKDLFLLQQKTLENITYNRLHHEHTKVSEMKNDITSVDLPSQIVKRIDWHSKDKNSMATITLEPESLGKMRVEVNLAATGEVSARFITQNKQAGDLLSEQLNQLKQSLSEQGLKLGNFSVATEDRSSSGFQQYMPDFNGKRYGDSIKNDKEDYSLQLNNKITTSQMDYFV
ncbi:MAG: flagellar hook-length control protein FliK [Candidatus Eremiobacterota bacterium]